MKDSGFLKILFIVLLGTFLLQSCDMGKYYFRMHPTARALPSNQKQSTENEIQTERNSIKDERQPSPTESGTTTAPLNQDTVINVATVENATPVQQSNQAIRTGNERKLNHYSSPSSRSNRLENSERNVAKSNSTEREIALVIYFFVMIIIVFTGLCVFLISWIFAPAILALKIALWTIAGLSLFPTVLLLIVFSIS